MTTILIVDDLAANRSVLVTLLAHQGHRMLEATNGSDALAAVRSEHPDLVITDVLMPVMDGYELARQLRLDAATRSIPIVFYTAHYGEREARARALAGGVSYVLSKPSEAREVLEITDRALSAGAEPPLPAGAAPPAATSDRDQLNLLTGELSTQATGLRGANARLRAMINIGLELASERDTKRLLEKVCDSARDLFGATYVTLGIVDLADLTVQRFVTSGTQSAAWIRPGDTLPGILETVVAERRTLRGDNPQGDPTALQLPSLHPEVHAFLAAPIGSPTRVYGWLCFVGNEGLAFDDVDESLVSALAGQVGRIYESSQFAALAQQRARELEREILERQQVETALRHERDRAQAYLDKAEVILLKLDVNGRITLVNRYACEVLGWTEAELIGQSWMEMCTPERIRDSTNDRFRGVVAGDLSLIENPILTRNGEERLFEWRNSLQRDDEGSVIGTFSSGTDITDRNQATTALRDTEERTRFALEAAGVGIWDQDFVTGALRWSETLEAQYGLAPGAFGGTFEAFLAGIHPDDLESVTGTITRAMKNGSDFTVLHRAIWPDGSVRWLSGAGRVLLGRQGEPVRGIGISMDVTERRTVEEQHQQAQRMEAIGRLAGGVAHDFNNLLTAILGYSELLLGDFSPNDSRRTYATNIQLAGKSAARLTRQLLAYSRKEIIEAKRLDLNAVLAEMRPMLGRLIREDVKVVLQLPAGLAPVMADRGQLEQIILNLAVNAQDAMPDGGTLTLETAVVELDADYARTHIAVRPGPHVVLTVTDTGVGMTPEVQARLFEPFFTTKEPGKGTGFGLATVHSIVARSGGTIGVRSETGRGTTFTLCFPEADACDLAAELPPADAPPSAGGGTVLVVEDSSEVRELTMSLLQRQGYTVLGARNAEEAVGLFEQNPSIDVLLTDVVMPGGSGPELVGRLGRQWPALKAIYMSGYTEEAILHHGVMDPGINFLHKPFTSEALGQKVREVLDGGPAGTGEAAAGR